MTINGKSTGGPHPVRCTQSGWSWRIQTPEQAKGFTADIGTGDEVVVRSVDFRDLGGFTGTFWQDHLGEAEVGSTGGKYTISGSADGSFNDTPSNEVTTTFRIEADC